MAHDGDATRIVEGKRVSKDFREVHADSIGTGSLSTGEATTTEHLSVEGGVSGSVAPAGKLSFVSEYVGVPNSAGRMDPQFIDNSLFDDGKYRIISGDPDTDETFLETTEDFSSFTTVSNDVLPGVTGTGQCAGATVLEDGRALVLVSTDSATDVYTASGGDFTNLSRFGQFAPEPDGGLFYDRKNGVLHYYPEDAETASGVSSDVLSHFTVPDDDLTNPTQQSDAIDVSPYGIKTGDPEVIEVGDWYYMFLDNTVNHPNYRIALAVGKTLDSFGLIDQNITPERLGGDMTVVQHKGRFEAFTEYDDGSYGLGHWRLWPAPQSSLRAHNQIRGGNPGPEIHDAEQGHNIAKFIEPSDGQNLFTVVERPDSSYPENAGFAIEDKEGNIVGKVALFGNRPTFEAQSGGEFDVTVAASGQTEMRVSGGDVQLGDTVTLSLGTNGAQLRVNGSGEVEVVDEAGNITVIS